MAKSFLELSLGTSGIDLAANINVTSQKLLPALVDKMTVLMTKLQEKAQANAPKLSGDLAASITNPRAELVGKTVVGKLDWGGGNVKDYALPQEIGGQKEYPINPKESVGAYRGGTMHGKQIPGHPAYIGKKVLMFEGTNGFPLGENAGKFVFAPQVFRPPLKPKWFMRDSLAEMKLEIIQGLSEVLSGIKREIKPFGL